MASGWLSQPRTVVWANFAPVNFDLRLVKPVARATLSPTTLNTLRIAWPISVTLVIGSSFRAECCTLSACEMSSLIVNS